MSAEAKLVGDLVVGDFLQEPYVAGDITEIREHGTRIGDGSVEWRTLWVREGGRPFSAKVGPLRADLTVPIRQPGGAE